MSSTAIAGILVIQLVYQEQILVMQTREEDGGGEHGLACARAQPLRAKASAGTCKVRSFSIGVALWRILSCPFRKKKRNVS
jgi:hypothetical protein